MDDLRQQMLAYLSGAWRRRWYGVLVAWAVCLGGWTYVATMPDQYEAEAKVYVDTDSIIGPLLRDLTVAPNVDQQIAVMLRTLVTRPTLEKVARMTDLDLTVNTERDRDELLTQLGRKIGITSRGAKNLFGINYTDNDPEVAQKVVQALLTIFVETNLSGTRGELQKTTVFLDGEIAGYRKELQEAEQQVAAFKREHIDVLPQGGINFATLSSQTADERREVERNLEASRIKRDNLRKQLASTPPMVEVQSAPQVVISSGGVTLPPNLASLATRIQEQQRSLDQLLLRYTDQHPDVIATRRQLAQIQEQYDREEKAYKSGNPEGGGGAGGPRIGRSTMPNALYGELRLKLVEAETEVEMLERRLVDVDGRLQKINALAQRAPDAEAKLANLARDYEVKKKAFEALLTKRESARMSQAADDKSDRIQFRVIDPPRTPVTPAGPPRPFYMSLALALGIGAGAVFAFVLSQLDSTYSSTKRLKLAFNLPVLGSVSRLVTARDRRRQMVGLLGFGFACTVLLMTYGGMMVIAPKLSALLAAWA